MPRVQEKKEAVYAKPRNPFAALAESDSDVEPMGPVGPMEPAEPVVEAPPVVEVPTLPMRTWPAPERNVFSSPFSKKRWAKPRFKEDTEGWVSIRWNQPQFEEDGASAPLPALAVKYQPRTPPFYPLVGPDPDAETKVLEDDSPLYATSVTPPNTEAFSPTTIVLENTITSTSQEQLTALAWAEKVKQSLEKAEAARASKGRSAPQADEDFKEALGRLSFFRRGMVTSPAQG